MIHERFRCNHHPLLHSSSVVVREIQFTRNARSGDVAMNRHESFGPRACLTLPCVTRRKRGGQMMGGRRTRKTGGVFAGIRCEFFGTEKNVEARPSFAAVEW